VELAMSGVEAVVAELQLASSARARGCAFRAAGVGAKTAAADSAYFNLLHIDSMGVARP
jgi:hypothetical protein